MTATMLPRGWEVPVLDDTGNPAFRLMRAAGRGRVERFIASVRDPRSAERAALARVLDAARGTAFARRHGLDRVNTVDDYRRAVPIRPWAAHADALRRVAAGETSLVVRHPVRSLVKTSGTTGEPKLLPVTDPWAREVAEAQWLWVLAMVAEQPSLATGFALSSVGRPVEGIAPGGLPYGSNTGRMAAAQPWWVRARYAVPAAVAEIDDPELRRYVALRVALARDVRSWTTANPTTILAWCRTLDHFRDELAGDLADGTLSRGPARDLPRGMRLSLWPHLGRRVVAAGFTVCDVWNLAAVNCWKGGNAAAFLDRLPAALGAEVVVREAGISASEGYFAVPLHSSWSGGVAWTLGHLLEFAAEGSDDAVGIADVVVGNTYRLVISTTAGLYRYDLDDRVEVVGHWEQAPVLRFVGKGSDVLSYTGEKVTASQIVASVRDLGPAIGFSVGVRVAEVPVYVLVVEGIAANDLGSRFDAALRARNVEYDAKRANGRLGEAVCIAVPDGTYARWRDDRVRAGVAEGQVKDPIVVDEAALQRLLDPAVR